jgi:hypothetical protein
MISPQESNPILMHDLQDQHVQESLDRIESTIDVVTHEKVVGGLAL